MGRFRMRLNPLPRRRLGILVPGALLLAAWLMGCGGSDELRPPERVFFVAVDALSWDRLEPLMERGELPHFRELIEGGASGRAQAPDPLNSAGGWTTIQTGKLPQSHRVFGGLFELPSGERSIMPSSVRRTKTVWHMLGDEGLTVGVVGMPLSWPAEVVNGWLVSNAVTPTRWTEASENSFTEEPGLMDTFPDVLFDEIQSRLRGPDAILREDISRFFTLNETEFEMLYDRPMGSIYAHENPLRDFALSYQADLSYLDSALYLQDHYAPRVLASYFELLSSLQPVYWFFSEPELFSPPPDGVRRFGNTVNEAYRYLDEQLGRILESLPERSAVIVMSEHGYYSAPQPPSSGEGAAYKPEPSADAVLILHGQGFRRGVELSRAQITDLAPTLLALMGAPLASDLDGRVLREAFVDGYLEANDAGSVSSYDDGWNSEERYPFPVSGEATQGPAAGE